VIILGTGCLAVLMTRFAYIQKDSNDLAIEKQHINFNTLPTAHRLHSIWLIGFISIFLALCLAMLFSNKLLFQASFSFYKTGALVFGGGHVVLPMLHQDLVNTGLISKQDFELGYTLAQFMPGPLFSFASYLGAYLPLTTFPIVNAAITTLLIFLPSFFFVFLALPYWSKQLENRYIENSVMLINAAVVGFILSVIVPMLQKTMGNPLDILTTSLMLLSLKLKISIFISIPSLLFIHYALLNFI
jgi:chromate transporter